MLWNEECAAPSSLSHLNQFPGGTQKKHVFGTAQPGPQFYS